MRPFEDNKFHEIDIKFMCCTVRLIQIERTNERRHNDGTRSAVHRVHLNVVHQPGYFFFRSMLHGILPRERERQRVRKRMCSKCPI